MMVFESFIFPYEKMLQAQEVQEDQRAQKAIFIILNVFMPTKSTRRQKSFFLLNVLCTQKVLSFLRVFVLFYVKQVTFFFLDIFYAHLKLPLFLFACVRMGSLL